MPFQAILVTFGTVYLGTLYHETVPVVESRGEDTYPKKWVIWRIL